jgi:glycosyltransferase involved in cell wall biosynthesis
VKLSVAVCCYNGQKYIEQQLLSILDQQLPVDEVVLCDDASTDGTLQIVAHLNHEKKHLISVHKNSKNIGLLKNFEKAVQLCSGDIIFFSDQDDYWFPDKTQATVEFFTKSPRYDAVFTDAILVNDDGAVFNPTLWQVLNFKNLANTGGHVDMLKHLLYQRNVVTGACMAIRKTILPSVLPFVDEVLHDEWIALKLAVDNKIYFINQPLIKYRIHANQTSFIRDYVMGGGDQSPAKKEEGIPNIQQQPLEYYRHWKRRMKMLSFLQTNNVTVPADVVAEMAGERKKGFLAFLKSYGFVKRKYTLAVMWLQKKESIRFLDILID